MLTPGTPMGMESCPSEIGSTETEGVEMEEAV